MLRLLLFGLGLLLMAGEALAVEIEGTVREASGGTVSIVTQPDLLPNIGDKVDFFFLNPGTSEEVRVGSGSVSGVSVSSVSQDAIIEVKIGETTGEVSKDHLARIHSETPVKGAATPPAAVRPAPDAVPPEPTVIAGGQLRSFEYDPELIWDVAFSPDGTALASGFHDGRIALWDVASGKIAAMFNAHEKQVAQVAFSPDGSLIASASDDKTAALWNAKSGELKYKLKGHTDEVEAVAFSSDGKLASGSADNTIRIWNVQTGELLRIIKGQTYTVNSLEFSPDGALIASAGWADGVTIWDVASGGKVFGFSNHPHYVDEMAFSPDWSRAATATDNLLKIWDVRTGELLHTLEHGPEDYWEIETIRFSPDGSLVVSADERAVKIWDAATGALRLTVTDPMHVVNSVVFSPDGTELAIGGGAIKVLNIGRGLVVKR